MLIMISMPAYSFEIDGFQSGMSYEAAKTLIESQSFDRVELGDNYMVAQDLPDDYFGRLYSLNFCKGQLTLVQKNLNPRFDYFVRLIHEKRNQLGQPLDAWSEPNDVTSMIDSNAVFFIWRDGSADLVTVSYVEFTSNSQLSITYETRNECRSVSR